MKWRFWEKPKRKTRLVQQSELAGDNPELRQFLADGGSIEIPIPGRPDYERDQMAKNTPNYMTLTGADVAPMIHQITAPIVWRDDPVGTRYGPGRCNLECSEVHAYAEKVNATTVAYERPCEPADMGAKEWRERQKR